MRVFSYILSKSRMQLNLKCAKGEPLAQLLASFYATAAMQVTLRMGILQRQLEYDNLYPFLMRFSF